MIVTLQTQRVRTLEQVRRVAEGNEPVDFAVAERESAYEFIRRTLVEFDYTALGKADKGAVKAYLSKMTGLSRAQVTRLVSQHRETGRIRDRRCGGPARPFERRDTAADVRLLADVGAAMSSPSTRTSAVCKPSPSAPTAQIARLLHAGARQGASVERSGTGHQWSIP